MANLYIKNYILNILNIGLGLLFPIITFPYVSRVLGADYLGLINFVQSYGYYFMHFASFGVSSYAIRELSKVRSDFAKATLVANEIFNINLFFSIISGVIYLIGVIFVPKFRIEFFAFLIYSVTIFTNFLSLEWILQTYDDYRFSTIRNIIIRVCSLIAVFVFVKAADDFIVYMIISTISEVGARFSNIIYCKKQYFELCVKKKFLNFKEHIKGLSTLFVFRFVNGISANLDKLMIGFYLTYYDVGIYSAGIKFVLLVVPLIESVGIVLFPRISELVEKSPKQYMQLINMNYNIIIMCAIPMAVGLYLISDKLIVWFAGESYVQSIVVTKLMSIVICLCPIGDLLGSKILLVHRKDSDLLKCSILVAISNMVLNAVLIPLHGIEGATIATVTSYFVAIISRLYYSRKIVEFSILNFNVLKYVLFTIPFAVIYHLLEEKIYNDTIYMFIFIFICMLIYVLEIIITKDDTGYLILKKIGVNK